MNKQKVLIVDDNNTNIRFIADTLKEIDYISIVFATNGFKAIEIVQNQDIDLILMDINMPELDGFETVKRMNTSTAVIYITALDDKQNIIKAFENKAVDYITKPFYPQELIARVTTHLRLIKLNKKLEEEVEAQVEKNRKKEELLIQQSKLASMGEMIDAIAHQWIQPINIIKLRVDVLAETFKYGEVDQKQMDEFKDKIGLNIDHMINTLNEFRTFFRPNIKTEIFNVKEMIDRVLLLINDEFLNNKIEIVVNEIDGFNIIGVENEFKHLVLNLLNNAKDAFNENNTPFDKRKIEINIKTDGPKECIEVIDNAGGIKKDLIDNIFSANISSKKSDNNSGIGLYLSSQIAQKHNGVLKVENLFDGAKFIYEQNRY